MVASGGGSWDSVRQSFADQFEQDGSGFVYRRSQKGEAFRVSADERSRFIEQFDRDLRRARWMIYLGITFALGAVVLFSVLRGSQFPEAAAVAAFIVGMAPYFVYFRRAWAAPARELAGRTPIARELSSDEVRELKFRKITYGNLAAAAFGGLAVAFFGSRSSDLHSPWIWLWVAPGAALVLFAAVQAFRKWRFDQEEGDRAPILPQPVEATAEDPADVPSKKSLWRFVPLGVILLGFLFIAYTAAGHRLAQAPAFWPAVMAAIGAWALFSVAQGFRKGKVMPFVRGFADSYDRETQPKRFWASMAWNCAVGLGLLWAGLVGSGGFAPAGVQEHCSNEQKQFTPQESIDACTQLIDGGARLTYLTKDDAYVYRAIANERLGDRRAAVSDYSEAIRLNPSDKYAYLDRGLFYMSTMRLDEAVADFTRAHQLDPKSPLPLANRGMAYAWKNDRARAELDFASVRAFRPANIVVLHGEGVLDMNAGDLEGAIANFTAALRQDPSDRWALGMRADAYQQMGDFEKAREDRQKLQEISRN
jgi:Flp pilus assembly protein TadD